MAWSFIDGVTTYTLAYGPKTVDYIITNNAMRKKYNVIKVPMNRNTADSLSYFEIYPTYTMDWPLVTSALYEDLASVPMHKTIILVDGIVGQQFNIQITNRAINNLKTINNSEVIRSIMISFRMVA